MKIAANLSMLFVERPLRERVQAACAAGFAGVEIQFPYEVPAIVLKEALDAAGVPLVLINLPAADLTDGGPGLAAVPARQAAFDKALEQALSYAAMVRPLAVNVLPGRLAEGVERAQALATLTANLRRAAEAFAVLGIGVLVEAINPLDMPGFLINTPDDLAALLDAVDHRKQTGFGQRCQHAMPGAAMQVDGLGAIGQKRARLPRRAVCIRGDDHQKRIPSHRHERLRAVRVPLHHLQQIRKAARLCLEDRQPRPRIRPEIQPRHVVVAVNRGWRPAEIAEVKMPDLNANDIEAATKIIEGSATSMGLEVVEG